MNNCKRLRGHPRGPQRILHRMTNWQHSQWLRAGAPQDSETAAKFLKLMRRPIRNFPTIYDYILEKHS